MDYVKLTVRNSNGRQSEIGYSQAKGVLWVAALDLVIIVARDEAQVLGSQNFHWFEAIVNGEVLFHIYDLSNVGERPQWYAGVSGYVEESPDPYLTAARMALNLF